MAGHHESHSRHIRTDEGGGNVVWERLAQFFRWPLVINCCVVRKRLKEGSVLNASVEVEGAQGGDRGSDGGDCRHGECA